MEIVLTVKNSHKIFKPTKDDVILYDGKIWYVTTKEQLFKEWTDLLKKSNAKLEELEQQNKDFKLEVSRDLKEMSDLIEQLFTNKENNELWEKV